jgi:hypothetical protein
MPELLTPLEFVTFRKISKKYDEEKVNESIELAEESDLFEALGDFYFDVLENKASTDQEWIDLFAGSTFEYCGEKFIHKGIKRLLADFTMSRYVYIINAQFTSFGCHTKPPVDRNTTRDLSKQAQLDAGNKLKTIKKYILSLPESFPRYCKGQRTNTGFKTGLVSTRLSTLGRGRNRNYNKEY